jgi:lipopolysaccharide export system permease protein
MPFTAYCYYSYKFLGANYTFIFRECSLLIGVISKMIAQDLVKTLSGVLSVLVIIIVSRKFIRILDQVVEGLISSDTLLTILLLKIVVACVTFLPAATFMAILMVLGRMYRDREMSAIASAGGGLLLIYKAVFLVVFPLSLLSAVLSLTIAPWAESQISARMLHDSQSADLRALVPGKFNEYSHGDIVFYIEEIDENKQLKNIFVQHRQKDNTVAIINATSGRLVDVSDGLYVRLFNGERVQGVPGELSYTIEKFEDYSVRIDIKTVPLILGKQATPFADIWQSNTGGDYAEMQRRLTVPLGILLLGFIAVPLAELTPNSGVYGNMLVGFLIYFSYSNFSSILQNMVLKQTIPTWLGFVSIHIALMVIGGFLLAKFWGWQGVKRMLTKEGK